MFIKLLSPTVDYFIWPEAYAFERKYLVGKVFEVEKAKRCYKYFMPRSQADFLDSKWTRLDDGSCVYFIPFAAAIEVKPIDIIKERLSVD